MSADWYRAVPDGLSALVVANCDNQYHYWFHLGESHAIRQMLGHEDLPQFVGNMFGALYGPEC